MKLLLYIIFNIIGLWLAQHFIAGFIVLGGLKEYLITAILLGILNLVAKPILKIITFPLIILTLGLFNLVLNAILIWLVAWLTGFIIISDLWALFGATLIFAAINFIGHHLVKHD